MSLLQKIIVVFFLLFISSNSFAKMVIQIDKRTFNDTDDTDKMGPIQFNDDGTKMFATFHNSSANKAATYVADDKINEYTLSVPYDISTATYAGNDERCSAVDPDYAGNNRTTAAILGFRFADDGMKVFTMQRGLNNVNNSFVNRFDLTTPYDISTCTYHSDVNVNTDDLQNGTNAGDRSGNNNNLQGMFMTNDGTKMMLTMNERDGGQFIKQYTLSTPYDLSTLALASSTAIVLQAQNPFGLDFSNDGKRLFQSYKGNVSVTGFVEQYSLTVAFDLSTATLDGEIGLEAIDSDQDDLIGITFNNDGSKMFSVNRNNEIVFEYDLACAFTVVAGKCPSITENKDRTGLAIAQIEIAKRNIDHSTNSALNRLKWIRRNKDKQNLTNLNIDFNFTNQRLASLTQVIKTSTNNRKIKNSEKKQDVFYWSEGSIAVGRIGDTNISSTKKIDSNRITFGADKFDKDKALRGLAFSVGRNNVDIGTAGSSLDTETYNITYYETTPLKNNSKFLDKIFGYGKLNSDLLTVSGGRNLKADRSGHQLYGTIRIKDEIEKNDFTFIPSGRFDIGHTILGDYEESGVGAIAVEKQHIRTRKIRAGLAAVENLSTDQYTFKRHGKIEYVADIERSSDFKYSYVGSGSRRFSDKLYSGALHNINGEIGIDIILPENFSIFLIYERNQALGVGHTDNLHIAIGYLPNKKTNYSIFLDGTDDTKTNYVISKNINNFLIDFKLTSHLIRLEEYEEASFNLRRKF